MVVVGGVWKAQEPRWGGWRGELLKKACQNNENKWRQSLMRWRELHLWSVFGRILLHRCRLAYHDHGELPPCMAEGKLRWWKMRVLILIIVQGQLFPHWTNSCWCVSRKGIVECSLGSDTIPAKKEGKKIVCINLHRASDKHSTKRR